MLAAHTHRRPALLVQAAAAAPPPPCASSAAPFGSAACSTAAVRKGSTCVPAHQHHAGFSRRGRCKQLSTLLIQLLSLWQCALCTIPSPAVLPTSFCTACTTCTAFTACIACTVHSVRAVVTTRHALSLLPAWIAFVLHVYCLCIASCTLPIAIVQHSYCTVCTAGGSAVYSRDGEVVMEATAAL